MDFNTYISEKKSINIEKIKTIFIDKLNGIISSESNDSPILSMVLNAINTSKGSTLSSRYGQNDNICFSESELIDAYQQDEKWLEYLIYRFSFKYYPKNKILPPFPMVIAVEAASRCNLRCKMCFQRNMDTITPKVNNGIMSKEVYLKFLSQIVEKKLYSIVFASRGEPLLNPRIDWMIKQAKERGVLDIKLNTNATLLNEAVGRRLLESGLDLIVFSIDSVNPNTYKKIRGYELEKVLNNIDRFLSIKEKYYPNSKLKTRVSMVVSNDLEERDKEIEMARTYWINRVDEFSVKTENDFITIYDNDDICKHRVACGLLWERLYVWYDGTVNPCDIDHRSFLELGNILSDDLYHIWHGKKMQGYRKKHIEGENLGKPCINCCGY